MRITRLVVLVVSVLALLGVPAAAGRADLHAAVDEQNVSWLDHVPTPATGPADPSVTGLAFLRYPGRHGDAADAMVGNGPFGVAAWSLTDPAPPSPLDGR